MKTCRLARSSVVSRCKHKIIIRDYFQHPDKQCGPGGALRVKYVGSKLASEVILTNSVLIRLVGFCGFTLHTVMVKPAFRFYADLLAAQNGYMYEIMHHENMSPGWQGRLFYLVANPQCTNRNKSGLLLSSSETLRSLFDSVDPKQTAPIGAVCSVSTLFASILNSSVMLGNHLQQTTSADDILRCIFSWRFKD